MPKFPENDWLRCKVHRVAFITSVTMGCFYDTGTDDEAGDDEVGDDGDAAEECSTCEGQVFYCQATDNELEEELKEFPTNGEEIDWGCAEDYEDAVDQCFDLGILLELPEAGYDSFLPKTMTCGSLEDPDDCVFWTPGDYVGQNPTSGVYEVEEGIVEALVEDPAPLLDCDEGRWVFLGPGFQLTGANAGELMMELGFMNGDVPIQLNGHSLASTTDVVDAFSTFWYDGETEFTVVVNRPGVGTVTLQLEMVP